MTKKSRIYNEGKITTIVLEKLDSHMKRNEIGLLSYTCIKINPKWIKDLNVRPNLNHKTSRRKEVVTP